MSRAARIASTISLAACAFFVASMSLAQDLGHRFLGTQGMQAGNAPQPGIVVSDRFIYYTAHQAFDRNGNALPIQGLDLDVFADALGASVTQRVPYLDATLTIAAGIPIAHMSLNSDAPFTSVDRFGISDIFVQPLKLGWRLANVDLVVSYAFYIPTGWFDPSGRSGVSSGQFTNEASLGGTIYLNDRRTVFMSALASYDVYSPKLGIDITRGDTLQVQGGAGVRLFGLVDVGVAGYALWQTRDDRGADLPNALRGARERVFGLGPDLSVMIRPIHAMAGVRYEHDFGTEARPQGELLFCSLTWRAGNVPAAPTRAHAAH